MKKITAKFITENIEAMARGQHIFFRGAEYWMHCNDIIVDEQLYSDVDNGTIYYISADRKLSGAINGVEYAKVISGVAYKVVD